MRLSEFLRVHRESILSEWEVFAATCTPASSTMNVPALRDHASQMLDVIATDLDTAQSAEEQSEKSKGKAPADPFGTRTAAEEHGSGRADSGFSIEQMVAEYRALRATVIRLWTRHLREISLADLEDLTRFNEAIDQALAESVLRYSQTVDEARETFVAILGHDLRTPLSAVLTSATFMLDMGEMSEPQQTLAAQITRSSRRMLNLVADLLDFARSRLGTGIPIVRSPMSMEAVVHEVVHEVSAAFPGRSLQVDTRGAHQGEWDAARIGQALGNLITNAVEHGAQDSPVTVELSGDEREMVVAIWNSGTAIPSEQLSGIFNPMKVKQVASRTGKDPLANLGLGLFIAAQIVEAHGGRIDIESSDARGTKFTVRLPRRE